MYAILCMLNSYLALNTNFTERKREIYDQCGEEGLKLQSDSGDRCGTDLLVDPFALFNQFFGESIFDRMVSGFFNTSTASGSEKLPPIEKFIECSLEELFKGCTKKVKVKRNVLTPKGKTSVDNTTFSVDIKPGWRAGTRITYDQQGNQALGYVSSDVVFIILEKLHKEYERHDDDLIYKPKVEISLRDALCDPKFKITLLSGERTELRAEGVIHPDRELKISGYGMPTKKNPDKRGCLIIRGFDIKFPKSLSEKKIKAIYDALS